jgi:hypothetical protein
VPLAQFRPTENESKLPDHFAIVLINMPFQNPNVNAIVNSRGVVGNKNTIQMLQQQTKTTSPIKPWVLSHIETKMRNGTNKISSRIFTAVNKTKPTPTIVPVCFSNQDPIVGRYLVAGLNDQAINAKRADSVTA